MTHPLQQLSAGAFQSLAAGLAIAEFGAGVQAMGPGPDGGRDLYFHGSLRFGPADRSAYQDWDGYTVFQVKRKETLAEDARDNAKWLWGEVRKELNRWAEWDKNAREPVPDQLVFITNVPLTPVRETGGHDSIRKNLQDYRDKLSDNSRDTTATQIVDRVHRRDRIAKIRTVRFWDGNQVDALLTVHAGVRRRFDAFLTASDVFTYLSEMTGNLALHDGEAALLDHARTDLLSDGLVYFDQAGDRDNRGAAVHDVAIDLPVTFPSGGKRTTALKYVLDRGDHVLSRDITAYTGPRHIVLTGQPGNGKTTVSQLIAQAYRCAVLNGSPALAANHEATIAGTEKTLAQLRVPLPKNRRWPLRIDLAKYAEERGHKLDENLMRYLAHRVSMRSQLGNITPAALSSWLRSWPWLLVLDGLDEVTDPDTRRRLIERVVEFVNNAEGDNCDLFVILTTRPVGYTENIDPTSFETVALDDLTPREAIAYGTKTARVRIGADPERVDRVVSALRDAAADENLTKLLRTPLQVLILSIIVDGAGTITPDRYSLFWSYYDTIVRRERVSKGAMVRTLLTKYEPFVQQLHERVGFLLQERSEAAEHSKAVLSEDELKDIAKLVLHESDFKPDGHHSDVLDSILKAATQRLVLIAPREDGFGFDVRSLQELMASLHIGNTAPDDVLIRLGRLAPSPHWRNTWLFAAGKLFSEPRGYDHERLIELVENVDCGAPQRLGNVIPIGHHLALDILDDGMARRYPKWSRRLLAHGLHILDDPAPVDLDRSLRILVRYADSGKDEYTALTQLLRDAMPATAYPRTATWAATLIRGIEIDLKVRDRTKGLSFSLNRLAGKAGTDLPGVDWETFDQEVETSPYAPETGAQVEAAAAAIHAVGNDEPLEQHREQILRALSDPEAAGVLEAALAHVLPGDESVLVALRDHVLADLSRAPLGGTILA